MGMNVNIALNLISLLIRVGGGIVSLVLVARLLPVDEFGHASIAMAMAALATLPANFGLNVLILKDGVAQAEHLPGFLRAVVGYRVAVGVLVIALVALIASLAWSHWQALVLVCVAILIESLMDAFICGLRVGGDYRSEITWGTWNVLVNLVMVALVCSLLPTAVGYGLALLAGRATVAVAFFTRLPLAVAVARAKPAFGVWAVLNKSWANFVELGSQTFLVQVDSLILAATAGPQQVAVYQAVMKLVHGASQLTSVMLNVALPKAGGLQDRADQTRYLGKVLVASGLTGVVVGGGMAASGYPIGHWVYQQKFGDLSMLCLLAGVFLCVRYIGAGLGIAMIARGQTTDRVIGIALAIVCVVAFGMPLSASHGAVGMMGAMAVGYAVLTTFALLRVRGASK